MLEDHSRRDEVTAVESDPRNVQAARRRAAAAGLAQLEVRRADASRPGSFADALPAHVLVLCGIFGNVGESDIERTAAAARHSAWCLYSQSRHGKLAAPDTKAVSHAEAMRHTVTAGCGLPG